MIADGVYNDAVFLRKCRFARTREARHILYSQGTRASRIGEEVHQAVSMFLTAFFFMVATLRSALLCIECAFRHASTLTQLMLAVELVMSGAQYGTVPTKHDFTHLPVNEDSLA